MAVDTFTTVDEWDQPAVDDFRRDHNKWPLIMQPDGIRIAYRRCSKAAKEVEDTFNLERHDNRNIAYGMAYDSSLVARLIALGGDPSTWDWPTKEKVHDICDGARVTAKAHKGADIGTAVHHLTHRLDRGEDVIAGPYQADLEAYRATMVGHGLECPQEYIECRIVNDLLRMAGSADRIVQVDGIYRIADIKTGATIDFGGLGWAAQLAAYAGGLLYDVATEQRIPTPPIDQQVGYIIHLPAGQGRCDIYEVDLVAGHRAAELANEIRAIRKDSKKWITPKSTWVAAPGERQVGDVESPSPTTVAPGEWQAGDVREASPANNSDPDQPAVEDDWADRGVDSTTNGTGPVKPVQVVGRTQSSLQPSPPSSVSTPASAIAAADTVPPVAPQPVPPHPSAGGGGTTTATRTRAPVRRSKRLPPDEGDTADDELVEDMRKTFAALPAEAQKWVVALADEGEQAKVPWKARDVPSIRRYQIGRAIVALADAGFNGEAWLKGDVVRGLLGEATGREEVEQDTLPLGAAIGTLDAAEATRFATLVDEYLTQ
jgi:hypothetical protein